MMYLMPLLIIIVGCLALHYNDDDMPDGHAQYDSLKETLYVSTSLQQKH